MMTSSADLSVSGIRRALLDKLQSVQEKSGYWLALCPAHEDHKPSLSVREHDDGVGVKCHAGCTTEEILGALGMEPSDLRPGARVEVSKPSKESRYYYYEDADGNPLFRVWRTPAKKFIQQRWDAESGSFKNGLDKTSPVLYRLSELRKAPEDKPVFVVEGEKDADRLIAEGLLATTSPMGAGKWRDEYADYLKGREVYVIPDNDAPGLSHAEAVAMSVEGARIVPLPGLPEKGDVSDWLGQGNRVDALLQLAKESYLDPGEAGETNGYHKHRLATFTLKELVDKEFPPIKWIVPGLLPEGTMLLAGKPKMGKSWMALGLCVSVATGTPALGSFEVEQGDALYLALEDNERRLRERSVKVLGGVEANHHLYMTTVSGRLDTDLLAELEDWLEMHENARLVVIDTVARVRAKGSNQRSLYEQDYEVGAELTTLAGRYGVAIVLVHHLKKGDADDPMDLISGSTGLTAGVDGAMVLNRTRSAADAVLKAVHRELKDDPEMALSWDAEAGRWTYIGTAEEHAMGKERKEILDVLAREDREMRPAEVADELGKDPKTVARTMQRMRDDGYLISHNYGKYEISPHADLKDTSAHVNIGRSSRTDVVLEDEWYE